RVGPADIPTRVATVEANGATTTGLAAALATAETYTDSQITALKGAAGPALDTLKEIDDQLASDESAAAALATTVAAKLKPRGVWTATTAYAVNDAVTANGVGWRCILAHTSGSTFSADPAKWERFGVGQVLATSPPSPATDDLWYDKA